MYLTFSFTLNLMSNKITRAQDVIYDNQLQLIWFLLLTMSINDSTIGFTQVGE